MRVRQGFSQAEQVGLTLGQRGGSTCRYDPSARLTRTCLRISQPTSLSRSGRPAPVRRSILSMDAAVSAGGAAERAAGGVAASAEGGNRRKAGGGDVSGATSVGGARPLVRRGARRHGPWDKAFRRAVPGNVRTRSHWGHGGRLRAPPRSLGPGPARTPRPRAPRAPQGGSAPLPAARPRRPRARRPAPARPQGPRHHVPPGLSGPEGCGRSPRRSRSGSRPVPARWP